jgi:16S rRNA G1207 methylase RsmC
MFDSKKIKTQSKEKFIQNVQKKEYKDKERSRRAKDFLKTGGRIINGRVYKCVATAKNKYEALKLKAQFGEWTFVEKCSKFFKIYKVAELA